MISRQSREELDKILVDEGFIIRRAFLTFIKFIRSDAVVKEIILRFRDGDIAGVVAIVKDQVSEFSEVLPEVTIRAAKDEINRINIALVNEPSTAGSFRVTFDPGNKVAAKIMEESRLNLIKQITDDQESLIRRVLKESLTAGENPRVAARKFKNAIGLTDNQQQAVENYRDALESGSRDALDRVLRDKRFDRTVESAIDENRILGSAQIERMVGRYSEKMLAYRAETIARTETMRAVSQGRHLSWIQAIEQLGADQDEVTRTWLATDDDRVRDSHLDMDDQEVIGIDTPFISGDGNELLYPGDWGAPPEDSINCRCSVVIEIPT